MKTIVISGINIRNGGTLTVYRNLLEEIVKLNLNKEFHIVSLVSKKELFIDFEKEIEIIDFPKEEKSRLKRFYYEYFWTKKYSKKNDIYCWISINDKTPNVKTVKQFVYCHNPSIFYKCSWKDFRFSKLFFLYTVFYKHIYKHNIFKNDAVILQQQWIAKEFVRLFHIKKPIVMRPKLEGFEISSTDISSRNKTFIFPTFPRSFKNVEILCEATKILNSKDIKDFEILITIEGHENKYARFLRKKYSHLNSIKFIGFVSQDKLKELYAKSDCLLFPSKLETWGLPMTEFSKYNRPIIASDLPYAHETLKDYRNVVFFNPSDATSLALYMETIINGTFNGSNSHLETKEDDLPEIESWKGFFDNFVSY